MAVKLTYAVLEEEMLHLPREDRSKLAGRLLESLEEEEYQPSTEWSEELRRRVREMDEGRAEMVPADQMWRGINQSFGTSL